MPFAYASVVCLSHQGSDRGTAYCFANTAVRLKDKTYAVWTDAIATTCLASYDHQTRQWSPKQVLGEGADNHNCPALAATPDGRLHLVYGPHGPWDQHPDMKPWPSGCFRYCISEPFSTAGLDTPVQHVGYQATYASWSVLADGTLCLGSRGGEAPHGACFQKRLPSGAWTDARRLMTQAIPPGYTHYGAKLAAAPDGLLYYASHFYSLHHKTSLGINVIRSRDAGETWEDLTGRTLALPLHYQPQLAPPHAPSDRNPQLTGMCLSRTGDLWLLTSCETAGDDPSALVRWDGSTWHTTRLSDYLPPDRITNGGPITCDGNGRLHALVSAADRRHLAPGAMIFAHPSNEIFHLWSDDHGATFHCHQVSEPDTATASWLPAMSEDGLHAPIDSPILFWTHGNTQQNTAKRGGRHTIHTDIMACVLSEKT